MSILSILKWSSLGILFLCSLFAGYLVLIQDDANELVSEEIRENPSGETAQKTMLLTLPDGRIYPVNFLKESNRVYIGIDGRWWREFVEEAQYVRMFIRGENYSGYAKAVLHDPGYKENVFTRLRPTVPKWLPDFLNGKLVVITLEE